MNVLLHRAVHILALNIFPKRRQNLGEALAVPRNSFTGFSDGHFLPIVVFRSDSLHVDDVLLATGAGNRSEVLLRKHGIILFIAIRPSVNVSDLSGYHIELPVNFLLEHELGGPFLKQPVHLLQDSDLCLADVVEGSLVV